MREVKNGVRWQTMTVADQAAVDRENASGSERDASEVAQRVECGLLSNPIEVQVRPVTVPIGDSEFSAAQGRDVREAFNAAMEFAEKAENDSLPTESNE